MRTFAEGQRLTRQQVRALARQRQGYWVRHCTACDRPYYGDGFLRSCAPCRASAPTRHRAQAHIVRAMRRALARAGRRCLVCRAPIESRRSTRRYCSPRCRAAAWRARDGNG
jgi:hypothetical protein